jgi:hypothetical protein
LKEKTKKKKLMEKTRQATYLRVEQDLDVSVTDEHLTKSQVG